MNSNILTSEILAKRITLNERKKQLEIDEKELRFQEKRLTFLQDTISNLRDPEYVSNFIEVEILPNILKHSHWTGEFDGTKIEDYKIIIQKNKELFKVAVFTKNSCCCCNIVLTRDHNCLEDCVDFIADLCEKGINL